MERVPGDALDISTRTFNHTHAHPPRQSRGRDASPPSLQPTTLRRCGRANKPSPCLVSHQTGECVLARTFAPQSQDRGLAIGRSRHCKGVSQKRVARTYMQNERMGAPSILSYCVGRWWLAQYLLLLPKRGRITALKEPGHINSKLF